MDTILIRSLVQIALLSFINYWQKNDYHFGLSKTQGLILIQAFCSGIMIFGSYNCLRFLPIGDAMTILFSSPLFTGNYSLLTYYLLTDHTCIPKTFIVIFLLAYYQFPVNLISKISSHKKKLLVNLILILLN